VLAVVVAGVAGAADALEPLGEALGVSLSNSDATKITRTIKQKAAPNIQATTLVNAPVNR
jgi:hypothetical protein